jgi:hypothetical protein
MSLNENDGSSSDGSSSRRSFTSLVGLGYWAFAICWIATLIRVSVHYLTPVREKEREHTPKDKREKRQIDGI